MKTVKPVVKTAIEGLIYRMEENYHDREEVIDTFVKLFEEIINDESLIEEKKDD